MVLPLVAAAAGASVISGLGAMGKAKTQKNSFHADDRTMEDPEFAQVLRRQAELGQGVQGPNIAAQTGRNQQALARNTARDQMRAVRGQQAAMSQDAANNAASVAASGRGATAGAARYQAANATATAAGSIAQQSAQTQQQIANTAQTTSRDIANNTATAASAENIERQKFNTNTKLAYAQQYQDYQKANLQAGLEADKINAGVAEGNAARGTNGSGLAQFASGFSDGAMTMAPHLMKGMSPSDKNAKENTKKITEAEFARRWNQRRKDGIPGQTVILNADDRKEVVQAPQSKTWHVKDKDHLTDFDRMWAERRRQGIPARREYLQMTSDIKAKEEVKPVVTSDDEAKTSEKSAREAFEKLEPYEYQYKEKDAKRMALEYGDPDNAYKELREPRIGIMAQDMAKSEAGKEVVGKDPVTDRLALDVNKSLSLSLASIADLNKRLAKLETRKGK